MSDSIVPSTAPGKMAAVMAGSSRSMTYAELDHLSRRLANCLERSGLSRGDHVAVVMENNLEWFVAQWGVRRAEMFLVPVNWHLAVAEIRHVIANSGARAVAATGLTRPLVSEAVAGLDDLVLKLCVGGGNGDFVDFADSLALMPTDRPAVERDGNSMPYSSGTTGAPKGIIRALTGARFGEPNSLETLLSELYAIGSQCVYLSPAPAYHSSPLGFTGTVLNRGGTIVHMERFDAEAALAAIEQHRVTHAQFVPTHFVRMLRLPAAIRARYDLSSLTHVIHAAAPCAPEVKRAMIAWLGPIVYEYYSGSERCGLTAIDTTEWLAHPGSVGRSMGGAIHIVDPESGDELPAGEDGLVYFEDPAPFAYHGDPEKTAETFSPQGWGTHGDIGCVDRDGFLYLSDRRTDLILSGGVNIYPQDVENALNAHAGVADSAVVGVPDPEFGQRVVAMIQREDGSAEISAAELDRHCRALLAGFKVPRSFHFTAQLPRLPNGKLLRRQVLQQLQSAEKVPA